MKQAIITWFLLASGFSSLAFAEPFPFPPYQPMAKVILTENAESWVTTKTARVVVTLNATLDKKGLTDIRNSLLSKLQKIASSNDWHITQFNRSQNQSGLEQLFATAEVRLPLDKINNVRDVAKSISKAGETYEIADIDFSPSLDDMEAARSTVRAEIYNKVQQELNNLNKLYPEQHYQVQKIDFLPLQTEVVPAPATFNKSMRLMAVAPSIHTASADNFAVSEKVQLSAVVELGAEKNKTDANTN